MKSTLIALFVSAAVITNAQTYTTNVVNGVTNITVTASFQLTTTLPVFETLRTAWTVENVMRTNAVPEQTPLTFKDYIESRLEESLSAYAAQRRKEITDYIQNLIISAPVTKQSQILKILTAP